MQWWATATASLSSSPTFFTDRADHHMSNWATLTEDDVLSGLTKKERDDFAKTSVDSDVPDRLVPIISQLIDEINGMIASRADNPTPPAAGQIPKGFKARAVSIARWRVLVSIPGYQPGASRKLDYENAEAFFLRVAEGKIRPAADRAEDAPAPTKSTGAWNSENRILGRMHPTPPPAGSADGYANESAPADRS